MKLLVYIGMFILCEVSYGQIVFDTSSYSYQWTPYTDLSFSSTTVIEETQNRELNSYNAKMLKDIFNGIEYLAIDSFAGFYTEEKLNNIFVSILQSDEVKIGKESEFVYDIQYGNYSDGGFGIKTVSVYSHLFIDIRQRKILPRWEVSFTY